MSLLAQLSTTLPYHRHIEPRGCEVMSWEPSGWISSQAVDQKLPLELGRCNETSSHEMDQQQIIWAAASPTQD